MTMREGAQDSWGGPARRQRHDKAYFLDLLGDSHNGLGRHEAAIEAYRQAAEGFRVQRAQCSSALCLFKVADSYLSLGEPWHALGYLEACLPLLQELGLTRHEARARQQLARCQAELTGARLPVLGEGRAGLAGISTAGSSGPGTPGSRNTVSYARVRVMQGPAEVAARATGTDCSRRPGRPALADGFA